MNSKLKTKLLLIALLSGIILNITPAFAVEKAERGKEVSFTLDDRDRRTALAPAIRKNKELEEREELTEKALKEYAKVEPKFAEILRTLRII